MMEIPEIIFQTINLHSMLTQGLSPTLIYAYVALMVVNCVYCFYHIAIAWKKHAFHEMMGDAMLDLVFALVFPAITLTIAIANFRGGLRVMICRQMFFPAASYERRSRLYGDANQITAFTAAFQQLQVQHATDLFVTIGFNLLTCLRWRRIVTTLTKERERARLKCSPEVKLTQIAPAAKTDPAATLGKTQLPKQGEHLVLIPQRVIPVYVGVAFLVYGAVIGLSASMAINSASIACASLITKCRRHAHQWFPGAASMACPCLSYIDGDLLEPRSMEGELADGIPSLEKAAEAGYLQTIQIVNRRLTPTLPLFLERCRDLQHLILVGCELSELPRWTSTFTKLRYL